MRHPVVRAAVRALVAILAATGLATGLSATPAAAANECAAYVQIMTPYHLYSHPSQRFLIWGRVYLAAEGSPCIGHNLKISIDVRPAGTDVWETRGTRDYGYNPLGSDDLGLRLLSWSIERLCGTRYRSRYVLDDSITVIESTHYQYC